MLASKAAIGRLSSLFVLSVGLSVGNDTCILEKMAYLIKMVFGVVG